MNKKSVIEDDAPLSPGEPHLEDRGQASSEIHSPTGWFPGCISARHTLAIIAFLGFVNVYTLRVSLSVALVAMVNSSAASSPSNVCLPLNNSSPDVSENIHDGEFNWDPKTQGVILGAFFWGYMITQIPGGMLAERYGAKILLGVTLLITSGLTMLTPLAARTNLYLLIALRVVEGLAQGVTFPAMHAMWSQWAPEMERSKLVSFTYSGAQLGTVVTMPLAGLLCDSDFLGGWPSVFYVFGSLGCMWFVFWMFLAYDTPAKHPRISQEERQYIESSVKISKKGKVPWLSFLRSRQVWAILIVHMCSNWGFYTLLTSMSIFIKEVLHFAVKKNGLVSAFPYLAMWLCIVLGGIISDFLRKNKYLSTRNTRKLMIAIGYLFPALFLVLTGYTGCNYTLAIVYLTFAVGLLGFGMSGFVVNHMDIAPSYAGTLIGITNTASTIPGIAGPYVVGFVTNNDQSVEQWRIVFFIASAIYLFGAIFYFCFGSGEIQSWAMDEVMIKEEAMVLVTPLKTNNIKHSPT